MAKPSEANLPDEVQSRIDFVRSVVPRRKKHIYLKIIAVLAALIVLAGIVWLVSSSQHANKKPKASSASVARAIDLTTTTPIASYTSKSFGLSLSYPKNWTIKNNGSDMLAITSPLANLVAANMSTVKGKVELSFTSQGSLPKDLTNGTSLAVLDSSIVTYANPSSNQSGQTYLSFVQYASTNTRGGLDGVYITGNYGYQKDQTVPSSDIAKVDPLIDATFSKCSNKPCTLMSPLTIASTSWNGTSLGQIITKIIESLVFS